MKRHVNVTSPLDFPILRLRCGCGSELTLSLAMMANNTPAVCGGCGARLSADPKSSAKSVQLLVDTMAKLEKVRRAIS
jgi:hypothetical protein